jgi:Tol biopolymer transport system component
MDSQRWEKIESLYHAALAMEPGERLAYLSDACEESGLRREIEELLACSDAKLESPLTPSMRLPFGFRLGSYEIRGLLGVGGMGEVYRARDTKLKRDVALKVLPAAFTGDPGRMARFQREAEMLAALNHPNIAHIYGIEENALVMELVEGESPKGPLPFDEAWKMALQIADALEYAHEKGVVHRDLKPANVKVTPEGVTKLLDFGLAKAFGPESTEAQTSESNSSTITMNATAPGMILGTAAYMSPEQARGRRVDKRSDIWSWGVMLYELLTGEPMFKGDTATDTIADVLTKQPDIDKAPPQVRRLLRRCLEKDPKQRLRDIGEARWHIETRGTEVPQQAKFRARWALLALAGVLAAALVTVSFLYFNKPPTATYRLSVLPPKGTSFAFSAIAGSHALSPDGRTLAFLAESSGAVQIWTRPLDGMVARRLDGTDGAYGVIWSPDGRYLAFPIPGKLRRIEVATGNLRDLCPAFDVRGLAWSPAGTIVFAQVSIGLLRVPAEGGDPERVVVRDSERGEEQHYWPQFLPDGRHFLYHIRGAKPGLAGTYVASLDSKPEAQGHIQVIANTRNSLYSPDPSGGKGFLLFLQGRTLLARRFDTRRFQLEGEAYTVAEEVGSMPSFMYSAFVISSNAVLAYSSEDADLYRVDLVARDGTLIRTIGDAERYNQIHPSHDNRHLALMRFDPSRGTYDIWLMDMTQGVASGLTTNPATDGYPIWSPDDKDIVFSSTRLGPMSLFRRTLASGQDDLVHSANRDQYPWDWSPDRKMLVYEEASAGARSLWAMPAQGGGDPVRLTDTQFDNRHPMLSPSGRWLAYDSNASGSNYDVYVQAFPHKGRPQPVTNGGGFFPRWSADEKELFYSTADNYLMALPVQTSGAELSFGSAQRLFPLKSPQTSLTVILWRPLRDGSFVVLRPAEPAQGKPINIVANWQAGLKR